MLIHTSGKKLDHKSDKKPIEDVMNALSDVHSPKFEVYAREIGKIAASIYGEEKADQILGYIVRNSDQTTTIIMNSDGLGDVAGCHRSGGKATGADGACDRGAGAEPRDQKEGRGLVRAQ